MSSPVSDYYQKNTRRFLRWFGSGEHVAAIHRQVWAPGVITRQQSFEYLNRMVVEQLAPGPVPGGRVLDLGCGIGGTTTWVSQALKVEAVGVTISPEQVRMARARAARLGLAAHCTFLEADFENLPGLGWFQGAWAIESACHAASLERFFGAAAGALAPGGRLVVVDDFLVEPALASAQWWVGQFQIGWRIPSLGPRAKYLAAARSAGLNLVAEHNLTPWLRTVPAVWIKLAGLILRLPVPGEYWHSLRGSTALQRCIAQGWTEYAALVFEK